ncbi:ATP-binding protein [Paucibacter soli]|uniref:ATP-binding protein n=1 Tax=Paucibacter soli TaxID=3133433 RepID=UPI0030AF63D6
MSAMTAAQPGLAFALDERAFAALQAAAARQQLPDMVALAWHSRQRDSRRALALAEAAQQRLGSGTALPRDDALRLGARLLLVFAEARWLAAELDSAEILAQHALQQFGDAGDAIGCADAQLLRAMLATERGDRALNLEALAAMARCAEPADPLRHQLALVLQARELAFVDVDEAQRFWARAFASDPAGQHVLLDCFIHGYQGVVAGLNSDFAGAAQLFLRAHAEALECGVVRAACVAAVNASVNLDGLNDHQSALEWAQRSQELATRQGWPLLLAGAQTRMAAILAQLQRFEAARDLHQLALRRFAALPGAPAHAIALLYTGELELHCGQHQTALQLLRAAERAALRLGRIDLRCMARTGQARAWLGLGDVGQALDAAAAVAQEPRAPTRHRIAALQVQAAAHGELAREASRARAEAGLRLQCLQQAEALGARVAGYVVEPELLDALSEAHAVMGELQQASDCALRACEARRQSHSVTAMNRVIAMQVARETAQAAAERELQRQRAESEAARARLLADAQASLEQLAAMGREITGKLDRAEVLATLHRHVQGLMDAPQFAIHVPDGDEAALHELAVEQDGAGSALHMPVLLGQRLLAVLSIGSPRPEAYGERELAILRTLRAYAAIALGNAEAVEMLGRVQAQAAQRKQLAALGLLVANVAHEINTPIATVKASGMNFEAALLQLRERLPALLARLAPSEQTLLLRLLSGAHRQAEPLSTREERTQVRALMASLEPLLQGAARAAAECLVQLGAQQQHRDYLPLLLHPARDEIFDLAGQLAALLHGADNVSRAMERVAKLVFALKNHAQLGDEGAWQALDLRDSLEAALTLYRPYFRSGVTLSCGFEALPAVEGQPDALHQVWTNLIHNALQAMQYRGQLKLQLRRAGDRAIVSIEDTGCGIAPELHARIFEPFFTTKPAGEGSGLGLDIVSRVVRRHGGHVELCSQPGQGASFQVSLPLCAAGAAG